MSNLLGACSLGIADIIERVAATTIDHGGQAASVLVTLAAEPTMTTSRLAAALSLSQPAVVRILDRLEAEGLLVRERQEDARFRRLTLTHAGEERCFAILDQRASQLAPLLAMLTDTEQAQLLPILEKLLAAMTTDLSRSYALCRLCDASACHETGCPVDCALEQIP